MGRGNAPRLGRGRLARARSSATTVATSPDGSTTATASGNDVRLERSDGTSSDLVGHRLKVTSVAFSPDGTRLLSASRDHDVILWDVATGKQLRVLRGHFGAVSDARFSPDGRWIVTAGPRSVGLWWGSEGELVRLLSGPPGPFTAVSLLPDSRTIVASSARRRRQHVRLPDLRRDPRAALARGRAARGDGRELTPEERELYFG